VSGRANSGCIPCRGLARHSRAARRPPQALNGEYSVRKQHTQWFGEVGLTWGGDPAFFDLSTGLAMRARTAGLKVTKLPCESKE